jgi:hypothetical protein
VTLSFGSPDEALAWADAWVLRNLPSRTIGELGEFEHDHLARFRQDYGRLHDQFDVAFDQLVAAIERVNYIDKSSWPSHRSLQFMMLAHNLKSFPSAMNRLSNGYYEDSITLSRTLYEAFVRVVWVSCYAHDPLGAVMAVPKGHPKFNLTNFVRDELRLDWRLLYENMSRFAHSNSPATMASLARLITRDGEPELFGLQFDEDRATLEVAATFLPFLLLAYLRTVVEILIGTGDPVATSQMDIARETIALLELVVTGSEKPLWLTIAADLGYVLKLMNIADTGGDWALMASKRAVVATPPATGS